MKIYTARAQKSLVCFLPQLTFMLIEKQTRKPLTIFYLPKALPKANILVKFCKADLKYFPKERERVLT